jgi:flagellar basal-body rod protein FlgF
VSDGITPAIGRQIGLLREMDTIAQNVANASTTGYRASSVIFSEYVASAGRGAPSVSMAHAVLDRLRLAQGALEATGGTLDLAIEGEGFFLVDAGRGPELTRAGAFMTDAEGRLARADGGRVLEEGGAPIQLPQGAQAIGVAPDGTVSADGAPVGRLAVVAPLDPETMLRADGTTFRAEDGWRPVEGPRVLQGYLEASNVDPVTEMARMVAVQNAYQLGQSFMDREDERMRSILALMDR